MKTQIHHFLLFSEEPTETFKYLKDEYDLKTVFPISNFGFFKSGMLWLKNSYLEIVNYPKDIPAPNSNLSKCRFVGIALKNNLSPDETELILRKNNVHCSEILNEEVLDKNGKKVLIAKIIILNNYFHDFRVFFVFHTNDFFEKKDLEMQNMPNSIFRNISLSVKNSSSIIDVFGKIGMNLVEKNTLKTSIEQYISIKETNNLSTDIDSFVLSNQIDDFELMNNSKIWDFE